LSWVFVGVIVDDEDGDGDGAVWRLVTAADGDVVVVVARDRGNGRVTTGCGWWRRRSNRSQCRILWFYFL